MRAIMGQLAGIDVRDRVAALLIMAGAAFPVRFPVLGQSASAFDVALLLSFLPWVMTIRRVGPPRIPLPYLWLGLGMVGIGAVSLLWTADRVETLLYVVACVEGLLAFAMMLTFLRDVRPGSHIVFVQAWLILLVIPGILLWCHVPGFLPPATLDPATGDYISFFVRFSHPFIGRSNNLAALLLLVVPPTVAWALRTRRWLDIAVAAVGEVALMLTISRGAFVGLAAGVAFYFILERRARRAVLTSLLWSLPSLGLAILIAAVNPTTQQYVGSRLNDDNVVARLELLNKARESLSGAGSSGLPAWLTGAGGGIGVDVHNTFVQQILSFGLLFGVVICLALILTGTWWYRRNNLHSRPAAPIFGIGVVAVLISFLFESSFEGSLLRPLIWLGWGMLVVGALRPSVRTLPWTAVFPRKWVRKPGEPARR